MNCRHNFSHRSRVWLTIMLTGSLIYSPLLILNARGAEARGPARTDKAGSIPPQKLQEYRSGELLIKIRPDAAWQIDQVLASFSKAHYRLRGYSNLIKFTLKDRLDVSATISALQQMDKVIEWAEPNYIVKQAAGGERTASPIPNDPRFSAQWALDNRGQKGKTPGTDIGARESWRTTVGARRIIIAVIDTGIDAAHSDLQRNLWSNSAEANGSANEDDDRNGYADDVSGWNFINNTNDVTDDQGHGTMIAGIIAAEGNNAKGITGVMQRAGILPLKALDASGTGSIAEVVEAMDFAIAHHASVINCSFGGSGNSRALQEAINRASTKGIIVVAAAGNGGKDLADAPYYPAAFRSDNLVSVTATNKGDQLASFSNWNPAQVQLAAPGVEILTTQRGGGFENLTGTSAAAALVAGVTGLLKTEREWASPQSVRQSLLQNARPVAALKGKVVSGGVVNAAKALSAFKGNGRSKPVKREKAIPSRSTKAAMQSANNLDTLRNTLPQPPSAYVPSGTTPPTGYEDPKPVVTANYASYLTQLTQSYNPSGPAGALPLQAADPTAANAAVGGVTAFLDSKQFNFTAPVLSLAGRAGLNVSLGLSYSSKVWIKDAVTNTMVFNADRGFPAPGWRMGFGAIQIHTNTTGHYLNTITGKYSIVYLEPNGVRRDMARNASTGWYETYDSSYLMFDAVAQILYFPNGTQMRFGAYSYSPNNRDYQALPVQIKDRNGNFVDIYYKTLDNEKVVINYVVDTAGRRIDFNYKDSNGNPTNRLTSISQNRGGSVFTYVYIDYQPKTIQAPFDSSLAIDPPNINNTQVWLPSRLTYPTGANFRFIYNSYGQMTEINKFVPAINGQGATERQVALTRFGNEALNDPPTDCPRFTSRGEGAENWQTGSPSYPGMTSVYSYSTNSARVQDPSNRTFTVTINGLQQSLEVAPQNASLTGAEVRTEYTTYEQDANVAYLSNPRVVERKSVVSSYATPISVRKTRYSYTPLDGMQLETTKDEYINETSIYRRTTTEYLSYFPTRYLIGLPTNLKVYAGPGTTLMSHITNAYDETGTFTDSNNQPANFFIDASADAVIQHDNQNYGAGFTQRGNLTSVVQHFIGATGISRVAQRTSYDTNGNRRAETDGAGNRQQFSYADSYTNKPGGVEQTHVYLSRSANPHGFQIGSQYDYFNGNVVKSFNQRPGSSAEEQPVYTSYDFADRWVERLRGDGGWMRMRYWDNWLAGVKGQKSDTAAGVDQVHFSFELFDGEGRVWRKANDHPDGVAGKYSAQKIGYDSMGHRTDATSVIAVNGEWIPAWEDAAAGWQHTVAVHDQFDRTTQITKPDSNIVQYEYNGCSCAGSEMKTVTDETGNKMRTETDVFGHVLVVKELNAAAGNEVYAQVTYAYDVLDRLLSITHARADGAQYQTRTFNYDGYSRLVSETHPESGTITYTYKPNDLVESVTNQRGITTTYSYNSRNLVTQISYNDGGTTPTATFAYDDFGSRTSMSDGEGQTTYVYNIHRQMQSETRTVTSLPGKTFPLAYTYNLADQVKSVNYTIQSGGSLRSDQERQSNAIRLPGLDAAQPKAQAALVNYSISGTVRQAGTNQPMPGVTVTATRQDDPPLSPLPVQTSQNGYYSIEGVEEGLTLNVSASKAGYNFTPSAVTVQMDGDKQIDFTGALPAATVTANPNPIQVCNGSGQGATTLTWNVTGAGVTAVQLRAGSPNGTLLASGGTTGSVTTGNWVATGTVFYLQNVTGGLPLTAEYTLATATVTTTTQGCPPPTVSFNKTVNYARNNTGAISGIGTDLTGSDPNATTNVASAMTYRAWNAYRGMNFGNGLRLTAEYNTMRQRMTSFVVDTQNGSSWLWRQYYDYYEGGMDNGKIRRISDQPNFSTYNWYQYDAFNRLMGVQSFPSQTWQALYTHDEWGNLRTIGSVAGAGGTITYQTNATGAPTNRISNAGGYNFSYDAAGNLTAGSGQTYSYDAANRLKSVNGASNQYGYDGDGKRVRQPGLTYIWSTVLDKVALEVDAGAVVQRAYVYLGSELAALRSTDGNFYWVHSDHLSSGRMLTSTAGSVVYRADFDPFGQVSYEWSASGNLNLNTRKFASYERDATGLDYARARTYTSGWGRFAQADPYGSGYGGQKPNPLGSAKRDQPQTLNRYSYVGNDPINQTDPSGLLVRNPDDGCICCSGGDDGIGDGGGGGETCPDCLKRESQNCHDELKVCVYTVDAAAAASLVVCFSLLGVPVIGIGLFIACLAVGLIGANQLLKACATKYQQCERNVGVKCPQCKL